MEKYDVNYFISKFENTPDEIWGIGEFSYQGKYCALGLCGKIRAFQNTAQSSALRDLVYENLDSSVVSINDGSNEKYKQATPKQRILAALYDIKAKLEPTAVIEPIVKEKTVYVVISESIRQSSKELVLS